MKKTVIAGILTAFLAGVLSGCATLQLSNSPIATASAGKKYVFVAKDTSNTYMEKLFNGFSETCSEMGATAVYEGPDVDGEPQQNEIIDRLIEEKVDGIAIAANDADSLDESLKRAMDNGINVISVDSAVNPDSRITHIEQADPEMIGRGLVQTAYQMVDASGGIAILSTTEKSSNQRLWVEYMLDELENKKYRNTPLVTIAYGGDDPEKAAEETEKLLQNDKITVLIVPTAVGITAAAEVIQNNDSSVKLTGLGLPSEMKPYIENGICELMYLWNPTSLGSLSAYTLDALEAGDITGKAGEKFTAGSLGKKSITESEDGGTKIILGKPFKFDKKNILEWQDM